MLQTLEILCVSSGIVYYSKFFILETVLLKFLILCVAALRLFTPYQNNDVPSVNVVGVVHEITSVPVM